MSLIQPLPMHLVNIELVKLPDWTWHFDNPEEIAKLSASLLRLGQLHNLVVRELESGEFEVVDGRRRLSILKQLNYEDVWVHNLGKISQSQAIKYALSLELAGEIDYAKLSQQVKTLEHEEDFLSLSMITPFTAERLGYFLALTNFDWSQFSVDEQVGLWVPEDFP